MVTRYSGRTSTTGMVTICCDERVCAGAILDLSVPGCHLATNLLLQKGQGLSMDVYLSNQSPMRIDLGVVRWAADGEAGIEYIRMSQEDASRLRRCVGYAHGRTKGMRSWSEPVTCTGTSVA